MNTIPYPPQALPAVRQGLWGRLLAVTFLLALAALLFSSWSWLQRLASEVHTGVGEQRSLLLGDGSNLHLEGASAMNVDLRGRTRQLQLVQGAVHLEVALDGRPMDVQVGDSRVQLFGTRFSLARHGTFDELVVFKGKAMVMLAGDQRPVSAGERVRFDSLQIGAVEKVDSAWRQAKFLKGCSFFEIGC